MHHAGLIFWTLFLGAPAAVAVTSYGDREDQPLSSTRCIDGEPVV
jgi:hypothetical protein